ncbi:MAG: hypothetical protein EOP84_08570 [Verrucomicrobiaceae bacterium]|nr:MAG: hypothetical protein EOP84_08570 [Verrucomicrobiaceae bacterium]
MLESFLSGAICVGFFTVALFFIKFWRSSGDRLFLLFSIAFGLLLSERIVRLAMDLQSEWSPAVYGIRLVAYGLIIAAIIDKNRRV